MSKNGFNEFKEALKNEDMRKQLAAFLEEQKGEGEADKIHLIVEFAADEGYEVSEEELSIEVAGLRTLNEEEMENVAGGGCLWDWSCFFAFYCYGLAWGDYYD